MRPKKSLDYPNSFPTSNERGSSGQASSSSGQRGERNSASQRTNQTAADSPTMPESNESAGHGTTPHEDSTQITYADYDLSENSDADSIEGAQENRAAVEDSSDEQEEQQDDSDDTEEPAAEEEDGNKNKNQKQKVKNGGKNKASSKKRKRNEDSDSDSDDSNAPAKKKKKGPVKQQKSIWRWLLQSEKDRAPAQRGTLDESKFMFVKKKADGYTETLGPYRKFATYDKDSKKDVDDLNKWRNQDRKRMNHELKASTVRWTVEESGVLRMIVRRSLRTAKTSRKLKWVKIAKKHWKLMRARTARKGTPFARTTRAAPRRAPVADSDSSEEENPNTKTGAAKKPKGRKPQSEVVTEDRNYIRRKKTALDRQARTFPEIQEDLKLGYKQPADGSEHPWDDIGSDFSCGEESSTPSEVSDDEDDSDEEKSSDSDPGLEEESDDEQDGQRPASNALKGTLVSAC